ncbi:MAG: type II toxin-antitoxin system HicA family toxin [Methanoregulaceae archaeon]|nr:type II toxin-antitoxin system HicA family toxin [Methanoregulaceae archaeon]
MSKRTRRLTASEVEALLLAHGFEMVSQRGSHRKWRCEARRLLVIVPEHGSRVLPLGTQMSILRTAEIADDEWRA